MIKLRMQHLALIIALVLAALLVHAYPAAKGKLTFSTTPRVTKNN
jgi:hypothetical protein